jgi:sugar transferase EpsL
LTGWAQVNGRNALTWREKFTFDLWYVDNRTFGLDLKILALTAAALISGRGVTQPGSATAEEFTGKAGG